MRGLIDGGRSGTFNVVSGESRTYREVVAALRAISPKGFRVVSRPRTRQATDLSPFDVRKLRAATDVALTPLEEGLRRAFDA